MFKCFMGPLRSWPCKTCGRPVSLPPLSMLVAIPFVAAVIGGRWVGAWPLEAALWIGGFAVVCLLQLFLVPLERR